MCISLNNIKIKLILLLDEVMNYIKKFISEIKLNNEEITDNINKSYYDKSIKNYELNNTFFLHTDKNTPLTNIISDNVYKVKVVNVLSENKIKGIININSNFLKFNFIILNKNFSTKEELYYYISHNNDIETMIDIFNNDNYFINIIINEINKKNFVLCNII
tara:strand:- start:84 stop:569 length:486 start_codon:yes stop_codon:yes gene_type:complete